MKFLTETCRTQSQIEHYVIQSQLCETCIIAFCYVGDICSGVFTVFLLQMWTDEESDWLKQGVARYGEGRWERIRSVFPFKGRTAVNIKDRWRTMKRLKMVQNCKQDNMQIKQIIFLYIHSLSTLLASPVHLLIDVIGEAMA